MPQTNENLAALARLIRRVMIGALTEREVDLDVVRDDLCRMIESQTGPSAGRSAA